MSVLKFSENKIHRFQWDTGIILQCDDLTAGQEIQFESDVLENAHVSVLGADKTVAVPDDLFQHACPIDVYVMDTAGSYVTQSLRIWVHKKSKPDDYVLTPEEIQRWSDLERRVVALENELNGVSALVGEGV